MANKASATVDRLEELVRGVMTRRRIEQAVIAVESGDRSFRWVGTAGKTTSGRKVTGDTPFFIASIDKLYNATITMMLSETGRLDLDAPIGAYLSSTITRGLHSYHGTDYSDRITVRHLLTHTSGLADWLEDYPKGGSSLVERIIEGGDREMTIGELAAEVRDRLRPHFPPQDLSAPRIKTRYSDTNFMLMIAIIEALTDRPLHEVHEQMLHKPLGLHHTYFPGVSRPSGPVRDPMVLRANGEPLNIPLLMRSIRGIYSTAADTIVFLRRFVRNEVFQNPETLAEMQSRWHRFGFPMDRAALRSPGWPIEYGIGLMRFRIPRLFTPFSPMPLVIGHTGSTGCWLFYCPELDIMLSGAVDEVSAGALPYRIIPRILGIMRKAESGPAHSRQRQALMKHEDEKK